MSQPDLSQLFAKAQEMQSRLAKVQQELARRTVEASAGGGMVTVVASGEPPFREGAPDELKYILLRNTGSHVRSTFTAVMEPFEGEERLLSVERLPARSSLGTPFDPVAVCVQHRSGIRLR